MILKLVSGETIMGDLIDSRQGILRINRPIQVRMVPTKMKDNQIDEQPVITVYCHFTSEEAFEFRDDHVIYCKEVYKRIAEFYKKTADEYYNVEVNTITVKSLEEVFDDQEIANIFSDLVDDTKKNIH